MEARAGGARRGSVAHVLDAFHQHRDFLTLADSTRTHYAAYAAAIKVYPTRSGPLGDILVDRIAPPFIRALIDQIADGMPAKAGRAAVPGYPTKANHWLRYLRRAFGWGIEHGACRTNPAKGVKAVPEVADHRMPERTTFRAVQAFARARGALGPREKGSLPPYLWAAMELAYQARLRGIEVLTLHDGLVDADGELLLTNRRKGSRDNQVRLGARTREAIAALQAYRKAVWHRRGLATPIRATRRPLFVSEDGTQLTRAGFNTAWGKMMRAAVADGVLRQEDRFGLHGLKHRGITDTRGTGDEKQRASGHKTLAMVHLYDHEVPVVEASEDADTGSEASR
ncbi:MAG: tyrosine-type recombinase/integrase [Gammaproteobacteria bacterium]|nr:tyrosine-type recombinase/integrase [Gammaproteobacteria bacterium]